MITTLKKYLPAVAGLLALTWFLVRVIPKPSRAAYPCQRAAFPIASTFVLWVIGVLGAAKLFRKATSLFKAGNVALSVLLMMAVMWITYWVGLDFYAVYLYADTPDGAFIPEEPANTPTGSGKGIFPGRVVWNFDPEATTWDGQSDYWWTDENTHPEIVSRMLSDSLRWLTETNDDASAWEQLFRYRNRLNGKGDTGYSSGESIAIKLNLNQIKEADEESNASFTSPQLVLAMLQQLVEEAGIPPDRITFYDAVRTVPDVIYDLCVAAYPGVRFMDLSGEPGRIPSSDDPDNPIHWSDPLTLAEVGGGGAAYIPALLSTSDYLINLAGLKGHSLAGVTFCAKNHFGSFLSESSTEGWSSSPKSAGIHPYVAVHGSGGGASAGGRWDFDGRPMGSYNVLVDLMGHRDLGGKTVLFLIDGLYANVNQSVDVSDASRWQMAPFNGGWTSSLFLSQDPVAIDSVALDFARSEPTMSYVYGNVDNYLHEAAQAADPPSGTVYDPEGDGHPMDNLGIHEHWNNASEKLYSRNLGYSDGIELIKDNPIAEPWWSETALFGEISYSGRGNFYYSWDLGWMHVMDREYGSYFYLYRAPQLGYLYSSDNYANWIWCFGKACWMLHAPGSGAWFYDASTGEYFQVE